MVEFEVNGITWEGQKEIFKAVEKRYGSVPQLLAKINKEKLVDFDIDLIELIFVRALKGYDKPEKLSGLSFVDLQNGAAFALASLLGYDTEKKSLPSSPGEPSTDT